MLRTKTFTNLALVLFLTSLVFLPVMGNGFTYWDEDAYLLANPDVRNLNLASIEKIFKSTIYETYSPLTILSFAIDYHFFGHDPRVYHGVNLAMHLAVVALVFVLALQLELSLGAATWASLLFGIHPIHVESVAWIVERKDVLYALFYMGALCVYLMYLKEGSKRFYWLAVACGVLSMLAKAMALSLPLILWLCDWMKGRSFRRSLVDKIPFFLTIVPIAWITYSLNARVPGDNTVEGILVWVWTFTFYIKTFFVPISLSPLYTLPQPVSLFNPEYSLALLFFMAILALAYVGRRNKWLIFSLLYYVLSIFFCLRFDYKVDVNIVADRFMYLPALGLCLGLGIVFAQWIKKPLGFVVIIVFSGLGIQTFNQCAVWKDSLTLWNDVLKKTPNQSRAYDNLAAAYIRQADYQKALAALTQATALDPHNFETYNNLGLVYYNLGNYEKSVDNFHKAIQMKPNIAYVYNNLGTTLKAKKEITEAQKAFQQAMGLDPRLLEPRLNLAAIYLEQGMYRQAEDLYRQNLNIDPGDLPSLLGLGQTSAVGGKLKLAAECYQKVLQRNPQEKIASMELGKIHGNFGRYDAAIGIWQAALHFYPNDPDLINLIEQAEQLKSQISQP